MDLQRIIGITLLGVLGWTVFSSVSQPTPTIDGKVPVEYAPTAFHWKWKDGTDGDQVVEVKNRSTGDSLGDYAGDRGLWHQTIEQRDHGSTTVTIRDSLYAGRWNLDAGPVLAVGNFGEPRGDAKPVQAVQLGIRVSPARVLFDIISPDIIATNDVIGAGFTIFPPRRTAGPFWSNVGAGVWYATPWDSDRGDPGLAVGLTTSFNH